MGPLIAWFGLLVNSPGFHSQSGQALGGGLCVILSLHSLTFISSATTADLLAASMAAELFSSTYLIHMISLSASLLNINSDCRSFKDIATPPQEENFDSIV